MAEFSVIEERPVTLSELKQSLEELETEGKLTFRGEKTKTYLEGFSVLKKKEALDIYNQIKELNIPRLRERHITKIVDIMPKDLDSLKIVLSGETITINDDDMKKLLDVIPQ